MADLTALNFDTQPTNTDVSRPVVGKHQEVYPGLPARELLAKPECVMRERAVQFEPAFDHGLRPHPQGGLALRFCKPSISGILR